MLSDIKILVLSCDKNADLFFPFHYCMEKYWPDHPEIIYSTESLQNEYYKTINYNYGINSWTTRIAKTVQEIDSKFILIMVDDLFLQERVNSSRIRSLLRYMGPNVASINFERAFDVNDKPVPNSDLLTRCSFGRFKKSVMCGLWNKEALFDVLQINTNPWDFELNDRDGDYIYLITAYGDYLNWGYKQDQFHNDWHFGLHRGKWEPNCIKFFEKEGLHIDYSIRGINRE